MTKTVESRAPVFFVEDGVEMVTITRRRFDELIEAEEDAEDLAAAYRARRSIDEEGAIPAAVSRAIRAGQNPVFTWRRYRGMTQSDLAAEADVTQAAIGRIEAAPPGSGRRQTLEAIAKALRAPIDSIDPIDESPAGKIRRAVAESADRKTDRIIRGVPTEAMGYVWVAAQSKGEGVRRASASGRFLQTCKEPKKGKRKTPTKG